MDSGHLLNTPMTALREYRSPCCVLVSQLPVRVSNTQTWPLALVLAEHSGVQPTHGRRRNAKYRAVWPVQLAFSEGRPGSKMNGFETHGKPRSEHCLHALFAGAAKCIAPSGERWPQSDIHDESALCSGMLGAAACRETEAASSPVMVGESRIAELLLLTTF